MATNWELLKRAAQVEFKTAYASLSEDLWNEALTQAIMDYSHDKPLWKVATLTLLSTSTDVALPADLVAMGEIGGVDGRMDSQTLVYDWVNGRVYEQGSYRDNGSYLRFRTAMDATLTLGYWGFHAADGSTLMRSDLIHIKPLFFSYGYNSLANALLGGGGRVQAGPVSWDNGPFRVAYEARSKSYRDEYDALVRRRGYGTRSGGQDFNIREAVLTSAGESLG